MEQKKNALQRIIVECIKSSLHGQLMPLQTVTFMVDQCVSYCFSDGYFVSDQLAAWLAKEGDFSKMELSRTLSTIKDRAIKEAGAMFFMPGEGKNPSSSDRFSGKSGNLGQNQLVKSPNPGEMNDVCRSENIGAEWQPEEDDDFHVLSVK